ncbi:winged helix-turn-helix domain-containing protein [Algoriphagus sp.]|uniref:winged helix-turn-helix domain-containing protein n=1 Tax=Algoriphagus sp. TaxID=1872435 RepID=UPI003918DDC6
MEGKEIRFRCWIDIDGKKFFGPGPAQLIELIDQEGSIAKAAKKMGMSYKKAWDLISDMNARGAHPYVISHKGGEKGGGAELTDQGRKVIFEYKRLVETLESMIEKETEFLRFL